MSSEAYLHMLLSEDLIHLNKLKRAAAPGTKRGNWWLNKVKKWQKKVIQYIYQLYKYTKLASMPGRTWIEIVKALHHNMLNVCHICYNCYIYVVLLLYRWFCICNTRSFPFLSHTIEQYMTCPLATYLYMNATLTYLSPDTCVPKGCPWTGVAYELDLPHCSSQ